jgi:hypothetical protein
MKIKYGLGEVVGFVWIGGGKFERAGWVLNGGGMCSLRHMLYTKLVLSLVDFPLTLISFSLKYPKNPNCKFCPND